MEKKVSCDKVTSNKHSSTKEITWWSKFMSFTLHAKPATMHSSLSCRCLLFPQLFENACRIPAHASNLFLLLGWQVLKQSSHQDTSWSCQLATNLPSSLCLSPWRISCFSLLLVQEKIVELELWCSLFQKPCHQLWSHDRVFETSDHHRSICYVDSFRVSSLRRTQIGDLNPVSIIWTMETAKFTCHDLTM